MFSRAQVNDLFSFMDTTFSKFKDENDGQDPASGELFVTCFMSHAPTTLMLSLLFPFRAFLLCVALRSSPLSSFFLHTISSHTILSHAGEQLWYLGRIGHKVTDRNKLTRSRAFATIDATHKEKELGSIRFTQVMQFYKCFNIAPEKTKNMSKERAQVVFEAMVSFAALVMCACALPRSTTSHH